jgi:hypothetical protein
MKTLIMAGLLLISACSKEIKVQGPTLAGEMAQTGEVIDYFFM